MLQKIGSQKHRLLYIYTPLFICKFLIVRYFLFGEFQLLQTLTYELVYILLFLALFELIKNERIKQITYFTFNFIVTSLLVGLVLYFKYSGQIVSIIMLSQLNQVGTVKDSVFKLIRPAYFVLIVDVIIIAIIIVTKKYKVREITRPIKYYLLIPVISLCFSVISYFIWYEKDQLIVNASYTAEHTGIFTYEIVCIIQLLQEPEKLNANEIKELQPLIRSLKNIEIVNEDERNYFGDLKGRNIIYVQLEAFQNLLINQSYNGKEITPFLNKLAKDSLYFPNIYQQIAAGSTSDAEFLSNTSLYPNTPGATTKVLGHKDIPSFPKLLSNEGYTSMTFHANEVEFWNRINLYPALGFDYYYDLSFFDEQQVIGIGPSDRVLFEKTVPVLKRYQDENKPFYAQLITLSSHHPFVLPDIVNDFELPPELDEHIIGDYMQVAHFVDKQLQYFFTRLQEENLLANSVVVLYGDHQGIQLKNFTEDDSALMKSVLGHDYTILNQLNIPLIIHAEGTNLKGNIDVVGGQIDILPTVANLVGLNIDDYVHFGQDLLNQPNNLFGIRYYLPYGSFFNQNIAAIVNTTYIDATMYDLANNKEINHTNKYSNDYKTVMRLLELNDKYLNSFKDRDESIVTKLGE